MTKNNILNAISDLKNLSGNRINKYRRNYRYYNATKNASIDNLKNPSVVGYYDYREYSEEDDTTPNPQLNIIASCIDTLTSKIAESKVRPFFNTVNGTFKDIQIVKQAQQFFDILYDMQGVNKTVSESFKDACIFDTGVIYIDDDTFNIRKALPWQVFYRPSELTYNKVTRIYYEQKDYPVTLLPEKILSKFKRKELEYVDYGIYYDIFNHVKCYTANNSIVLTEDYDKDVLPFIFLYYKNPILGNSSISITDMLFTIQQEINVIMSKIKDASQLNPALTFFLPEGSNVKVSQLNNRVGNVITYKPIPNGGTPVTSSTQAFIDPQYFHAIEMFVEKAYQMVGISQLSAQSQKPKGLNSGIALSTMEDLESDRFETQLNQVVRCYVDIAKTCIKLFDKDSNILPNVENRTSIKWGDIIKESDNMSIQYSGADSLSKDPSTKLQQLQELARAGVIPSARIAQLMQVPDLEMGYSLTNNAIDAVMEVIRSCIEDDNFNVPEFVPFELLKEEIINTQLSLLACNKEKNKKDIDKLTRLYEIVEDMVTEWEEDSADEQVQQNEDSQLPYNQNILEQEANMTKVTPDLDVATNQTDEVGWINENTYKRE